MQMITPNLWFDAQAEEAAKFYISIFKNAKIGRITRYGKEGFEAHGKPEGSIMTVEFQIEGQNFVTLNGGPQFKFNEAISLEIHCETQEEVDHYWEKLSEGADPSAQQCGWLKDKYGVSWQIVPTLLNEMVHDPDTEKVQKMLNIMYTMKKLEIEALKKAFDS